MESVLFSSGMNMWGEHHDRHSSDCTDDLSVRLDTANHLQQSLDLFQRGNLEMAERSLQIAHRNLLEIKQDSFFNIFKDRSFHCDVCNVCLDKRLEGRHSSREALPLFGGNDLLLALKLRCCKTFHHYSHFFWRRFHWGKWAKKPLALDSFMRVYMKVSLPF